MTGDRTPLREQLRDALEGATRWAMTNADATTHRPMSMLTLADAVLPVVEAETAALRERAEEAERKLAELERALNWQTSCLACSRVLDSSYAETVRAEKAEAAVERARELARHPRTSHGRVNDYVPAADLRAALDRPEQT